MKVFEIVRWRRTLGPVDLWGLLSPGTRAAKSFRTPSSSAASNSDAFGGEGTRAGASAFTPDADAVMPATSAALSPTWSPLPVACTASLEVLSASFGSSMLRLLDPFCVPGHQAATSQGPFCNRQNAVQAARNAIRVTRNAR